MSRLGRLLGPSHAPWCASSPKRLPAPWSGSAFAAFLALAAALSLTSCGAAPASTAITCTTTTSTSSSTTSTSTCTDPVTNISVTISPATVSVNVVTEQQFQDFIQGGTNSVALWEVNNIQGGNDTIGRIDSNGLYHAPATQPSPTTVTVTAVSFEDQKVSASSTVTITPAPVVTVTWTVNSTTCTNSSTSTSPVPSCATPITSGVANTATFNATETGGTTNTIVWSVGPVGGLPIEGGNATLGTINASGVFSAPASPPIGQVVTVTASALDAPTSSASLNILISGYSPSSLQGQFAFSLLGSNASGRFFRAGSFTANSSGGLSSVIEDVNPTPGGTGNPIVTTGTYTVGGDGRGTLTFNDGLTPSQFDFVLVNAGQLQIIGFDSSGTASGQANVQDPSTFFGAPLSALNGTYVFDFSGVDGTKALSQIGEFTADGAGNISQAAIDINDGGTLSSPTIFGSSTVCTPAPPPAPQPPSFPASNYLVSANGRGTLQINTILPTCFPGPAFTLNFYVVSRGAAKFVGVDTVLAGNSTPLQVAGYTAGQNRNAALDLTALNGSYAFLLTGSGAGGPIATAGSFSADGAGCFTTSTGVLDENVNGAVTSDLSFSPLPSSDPTCPGKSGKYTVASNGRGTVTFVTAGRTYTSVFYLGPVGTNTTAVFQETDSGIASDGNFTLQQSTPFTAASIQGNYAIATAGAPSGTFVTGQLGADGALAIKSGSNVDINVGGATLIAGQAVTGSYTAPAANGRATLSLSPATLTVIPINFTYAAYVVNSNEVYLLGTAQSSQYTAGIFLRQF